MMSHFGGPTLSDAQFRKLSEIVHRDSGIVLTAAKRGLLLARLNRRLRELNLSDYGEYCRRLEGAYASEERKLLLSAVTTNVTAFFREEHHFKAFAKLLPSLVDKTKSKPKLRFWSAACSSGEEAYSIAMTILETLPDAAKYDIQIHATDIDPAMILRAEAGVFDGESLHEILPERLRRHFDRVENSYVAKADLRRFLRFTELNLHHEWSFDCQFDAVFCRNVVIYFDSPSRQRLWHRLAKVIRPGGYLFIGHSERLDGPAVNDFMLEGATQYRRCPDLSPENCSGRNSSCR